MCFRQSDVRKRPVPAEGARKMGRMTTTSQVPSLSELPAGLGEWQIAKFIQDDQIHAQKGQR